MRGFENLSQLFMYVPGVIVFFVGSGQVRKWLTIRKMGGTIRGKVINCQHFIKKDNKDRDVMNYYNVLVEYTNEKTKHTERQAIKSPSEYAVNQEVYFYSNGSNYAVSDSTEINFINPFLAMIGGAVLVLMALEQNRGNTTIAMAYLALFLVGAGGMLMQDYISLKIKRLQPIRARVISLYDRQISKNSKILSSEKHTFYPVVSYELEGQENIRRCQMNSGNEKDFPVGSELILYYDSGKKQVTEKDANLVRLMFGALMAAFGIFSLLGFLGGLIG